MVDTMPTAHFSFMMSLYAIILGLGVTHIVSSIGAMIEHRIKIFVAHLLVVILVLLLHIQFWWSLWGHRGQDDWPFIFVLIGMATPIIFYLISRLLFPEHLDEETDLEEYY